MFLFFSGVFLSLPPGFPHELLSPEDEEDLFVRRTQQRQREQEGATGW